MTTKAIVSAVLCFMTGAAAATAALSLASARAAAPAAAAAAIAAAPPEAKVTELMSKDLKDLPGNKEGQMITVEYPPGAVDPVHRHNAHAFVYVLEGTIVMQLKGQKEVTLKAGETFYEGPDDVHTVGRNASTDKPAKFVVTFVKEKGTPILIPEK
jgi:quercetin dioxygenase-like cupin family protein